MTVHTSHIKSCFAIEDGSAIFSVATAVLVSDSLLEGFDADSSRETHMIYHASRSEDKRGSTEVLLFVLGRVSFENNTQLVLYSRSATSVLVMNCRGLDASTMGANLSSILITCGDDAAASYCSAGNQSTVCDDVPTGVECGLTPSTLPSPAPLLVPSHNPSQSPTFIPTLLPSAFESASPSPGTMPPTKDQDSDASFATQQQSTTTIILSAVVVGVFLSCGIVFALHHRRVTKASRLQSPTDAPYDYVCVLIRFSALVLRDYCAVSAKQPRPNKNEATLHEPSSLSAITITTVVDISCSSSDDGRRSRSGSISEVDSTAL